jgi:hypothetical protein
MTLVLSAALCGSGGQPCQPKQRAAGDVIHLFHVVPTVASASDGTPGDPGLAALADVPVAVTHTDPAQDAANVRPSFNLKTDIVGPGAGRLATRRVAPRAAPCCLT